MRSEKRILSWMSSEPRSASNAFRHVIRDRTALPHVWRTTFSTPPRFRPGDVASFRKFTFTATRICLARGEALEVHVLGLVADRVELHGAHQGPLGAAAVDGHFEQARPPAATNQFARDFAGIEGDQGRRLLGAVDDGRNLPCSPSCACRPLTCKLARLGRDRGEIGHEDTPVRGSNRVRHETANAYGRPPGVPARGVSSGSAPCGASAATSWVHGTRIAQPCHYPGKLSGSNCSARGNLTRRLGRPVSLNKQATWRPYPSRYSMSECRIASYWSKTKGLIRSTLAETLEDAGYVVVSARERRCRL